MPGPEGPFFCPAVGVASLLCSGMLQAHAHEKHTPARSSDGLNVFIDEVIVQKLNATQPSHMSRTAWVNHLLDLAL